MRHLEILVEELSMESALKNLLPRIIDPVDTFRIHSHQGKDDLLRRLPTLAKAYRNILQADSHQRLAVIVDRDDEDCRLLKQRISEIFRRASCPALCRIAVEELEAWFFGDIEALRVPFPKIPPSIGQRARFRDPDGIKGGTWEQLERVLKSAGYYSQRIPKNEVADLVSKHMDVDVNRSRSFNQFVAGIRQL